jgi:hypothetical protein
MNTNNGINPGRSFLSSSDLFIIRIKVKRKWDKTLKSFDKKGLTSHKKPAKANW